MLFVVFLCVFVAILYLCILQLFSISFEVILPLCRVVLNLFVVVLCLFLVVLHLFVIVLLAFVVAWVLLFGIILHVFCTMTEILIVTSYSDVELHNLLTPRLVPGSPLRHINIFEHSLLH